jgi:enoyl-CoA hydratase/carnithine racemase
MSTRQSTPVSEGSPPLLLERHADVLEATLNRPARRNALDDTMITDLRRLWADPEALLGIRCVVITGADPGFCGGADMSLLSRDRSAAPVDVREELRFLPGMQISCPVIVAVNGVCAGGGLHFVADADIALASEDAQFLDPHVSVGQVSALEPLSLMPRASAQALIRMALIGSSERLNAVDALRVGLISEVLPASELRDRSLAIAAAIAANSPAAVAATRRAIRSFEESLLGASMQDGWDAIRAHWDHHDAAEGPAAFVAKRPPRWLQPGETGRGAD